MGGKTKYLLALGALAVLGVGAALMWQFKLLPVKPGAMHPTVASAPPPAECLMPGPSPMVPDGTTASAADMKVAHDAIQGFVNQLEAYQTCREAQIAAAPSTVTAAQKETWRRDGNDAVDVAHALANAYSGQMRVFKARPQGKP